MPNSVNDAAQGMIEDNLLGDEYASPLEYESQTRNKSYEDILKKMCDENDLIFYTTQWNECVLVDYPSLMKNIDKNAFKVELWTTEIDSYVLDVNQYGYYNTVEVKYNGGTITESYDDLVLMFGEMKKSYTREDMNATEARRFALGTLGTLVRDFGMEIKCNALHNYKMIPGSFCKITNPKTGSEETLWLEGFSMDEDLVSSLTLKYAPDNPLVHYIPEVDGSAGGMGGIPADAQAHFQRICQELRSFRSFQGESSCEFDFVRNRGGNCWAVTEWIYRQFSDVGIPVRAMGYVRGPRTGGSTPKHTWPQINLGQGWIDFPFDRCNPAFSGNVGSGVVEVKFDYGLGSIRFRGSGLVPTYAERW